MKERQVRWFLSSLILVAVCPLQARAAAYDLHCLGGQSNMDGYVDLGSQFAEATLGLAKSCP